MPYETRLKGFNLISFSSTKSIILEQSRDTNGGWWRYELYAISPSMIRVKLGRGDSFDTLEGGLKPEAKLPRFNLQDLKHDPDAHTIRFSLESGVKATLSFASGVPMLRVLDTQDRVIHNDLPDGKAYVFEGTSKQLSSADRDRDGGISWYSNIDLDDVCLGLGEKAAPMNLSMRRFKLATTNAKAHYDAYHSDPLYKHLPFLLMVPNPRHVDPSKPVEHGLPPPFVKGIFTPSAAEGMWDLGCEHNDPLGNHKKFTQIEGPMDVILSWAETGQAIKNGWRNILQGEGGSRTLVGRQWLGYLASTMGQAESDDPPAQELLSKFPDKCKEHGIPCSAMFLSSGYTVDKATGFRMVFNWNHDRYPDFEGLMRRFHRDGIKISANIKPYVSHHHPHFPELRDSGALFKDPLTGDISKTQVWSGLWAENWYGSWVDFTSVKGRTWWSEGVRDLVRRGVDSTWNDDNEFTIADDTHICKWELPSNFTNPGPTGEKSVGRVGKIVNCELMGQVSKETLESIQLGRRAFVLTRSANVGSLQYVSSSWSGDNWTSWDTLRAEIAMGINCGVSFMHSYGDDVGGFAGPLPTPELFTRWVQSAVWRMRFCIHSFKPTTNARNGTAEVNEPWMYPEMLPFIRSAILRRYELIPYLYALSWEAATEGEAPMTWLGWDIFERDESCFADEVLKGQDFWVGTGKILVAGVYEPNVKERKIYLPSCKASLTPDEGYYDFHSGKFYNAGSTVVTRTPLEHIAVFVRVGTVIPIGKPCVTITAKEGLPATTADGTKIELTSEGGMVELDDWRGVEIYPPPPGLKGAADKWEWEWNEDDGESHLDGLRVSKVKVEYSAASDESQVDVTAIWVKRDFDTMWNELWVVLPKGDGRSVIGGKEEDVRGRRGYVIPIEGP